MTPSMPTLREEGVYDRRLGHADDRPISIFVPQKFEERYPYPVVLFLHGHGQDERQWLSQIMHLSRRNYIGVGLRGPQRVLGKTGRLGYGWGRDLGSISAIEDYVLCAIDDVRSRFQVNPQRIHVAGFDEGATLALQLGLSLPAMFSAVVAFNGSLPNVPLPLGIGPQRLRGLQSPRVLLGFGPTASHDDGGPTRQAFQLLDSAGMTVALRAYSNGQRLTQAMLRDADQWLMDWWNG